MLRPESRHDGNAVATEPSFTGIRDPSVPTEGGSEPGEFPVAVARRDIAFADTPTQSPDEIQESVRRSLNAPLAVPEHRLEKCLGRGGFGEVWLAIRELDGKPVAIKFFADGTARNWDRLTEEVKQLALLSGDPGIIQIHDILPESVVPYYIMEYAEGGSLADWIKADGALPAREAVRVLAEIAEGLARVHAKGIRHCDMKPANVLLDASRRARIADFGQAHLADRPFSSFGTFFYMAPEQAQARRQTSDTRWDVYGVGAIAYEMLTGQLPYHDAELVERLDRARDFHEKLRLYREWIATAPRPAGHESVPGVDPILARIIDRCLEADPVRRLRDAGEILAEIERRERTIGHPSRTMSAGG